MKKFKFKGYFKTTEGVTYGGLVIGEVYGIDDVLPNAIDDPNKYGLNYVRYYVETYPDDFEEVIESPFSEAEVVTLITFLNDNFEELQEFIGEDNEATLTWENFNLLDGELTYDKASLLIDKIEENKEVLTEAEKVTLITFLNDNFEEFNKFIIDIEGLDMVWFWALEYDGTLHTEASYLIDRIENL